MREPCPHGFVRHYECARCRAAYFSARWARLHPDTWTTCAHGKPKKRDSRRSSNCGDCSRERWRETKRNAREVMPTETA